jgi:hypothetical protein
MATYMSHPVYSSNSTAPAGTPPPGGTPPPTGSPQRLALDNLIRRELRVGDPNDPQQVAQALLTRYKGDPRALAIAQEARGLPFLQTVPVESRVMQAPTSSDVELQQAIDDVERDLRELTTNNLLKDTTPELEGWGTAVRSAITEGSAAARFSLDPRQRDKAFAIRRQLGDYARMARLVGALTPTLSPTYRKFAQSLDEVAAVLMVLMGEALSNVGFSGGRFLLQVPYSELQVRRDAVINALRNLVGSTQYAYDFNNAWPRGLDGYRKIYDLLEQQGQGDLRALLVENELARAMDELIQRAAHGSAEGLRALGATAQLDLQRFRRLVAIGQITPQSPPLTTFLMALEVFADAFNTGGGARLLHIARPPILFYGLYGTGGPSAAEETLVSLIVARGQLAKQLDCLLLCGCSSDDVKNQIILDKVLYDVDRAIDLYALGTEAIPDSPRLRARAYYYLIQKVQALTNDEVGYPHRKLSKEITKILENIKDKLGDKPFDKDLIRQELCIQQDAENRWKNLVKTMAPDCIGIDALFGEKSDLTKIINDAIKTVGAQLCEPIDIRIPREVAESDDALATAVEALKEHFAPSPDGSLRPPQIQRP